MRRRLAALAIGTALTIGLTAPAALATETQTFTVKDVTETFTEIVPCIGSGAEPATITVTYNGVFHVTAAEIIENDPDDPFDDVFVPPYHLTGTQTGTFTADLVDPSLPDFSGRFTTWFGENVNKENVAATFTFSVRGTGTDGSTLRFHDTSHFNTDANDVIRAAFDKARCN